MPPPSLLSTSAQASRPCTKGSLRTSLASPPGSSTAAARKSWIVGARSPASGPDGTGSRAGPRWPAEPNRRSSSSGTCEAWGGAPSSASEAAPMSSPATGAAPPPLACEGDRRGSSASAGSAPRPPAALASSWCSSHDTKPSSSSSGSEDRGSLPLAATPLGEPFAVGLSPVHLPLPAGPSAVRTPSGVSRYRYCQRDRFQATTRPRKETPRSASSGPSEGAIQMKDRNTQAASTTSGSITWESLLFAATALAVARIHRFSAATSARKDVPRSGTIGPSMGATHTRDRGAQSATSASGSITTFGVLPSISPGGPWALNATAPFRRAR
mmetsp:Transcript_136031/g.379135  ORF Transcript_136031/g.379135 Transcript_136031/m.379135 type:complete len:327 (-) Transcript_136031:128-1108(-)